jgi:hypothetical protein
MAEPHKQELTTEYYLTDALGSVRQICELDAEGRNLIKAACRNCRFGGGVAAQTEGDNGLSEGMFFGSNPA